jgi:hypothetical protein
MNNIRRVRQFEVALYTTVLLIVLCAPFFSGIFEYRGWNGVLNNWVRISPFLLIFLINNYIFVPKLLLQEKYLYYILSCIISIAAIVYLSHFLFDLTRPVRPPFDGIPPPNPNSFPKGNIPPPGYPNFFYFGQAIISFLLIGFNTGIKSFVRWSEERMQQADREHQHLHTELTFLKQQISPHFLMNTLNNIHALVDIDADKAKEEYFKEKYGL